MTQLSKNDIITCRIEGYSSSGDGIARIDGKVAFVRGALRDETCDIRILKSNKNVLFAKVENIIIPSKERTEPLCAQFPKCGGCNFLHMSYPEELFLKQQRAADALTRIGGIDAPVSEIIGADTIGGYRNKVIYAVGGAVGEPEIGFYRPRSHDIVPAKGCLIEPAVAENVADAVRAWMRKYRVGAYDDTAGTGLIRNIFIRHAFATGETAVCIIAGSENLPQKDHLISEILSACPSVSSIVLCANSGRRNTILSGTFTTLWGADYIEDTLCGLRLRLSPQSFYQINRLQAQKLYETILDLAELKGDETVLDLYCGTGTITLHLARHAKRAIGAEIVPEAIRDAKINAEKNAILNAQFIASDASKVASDLATENLRPDLIVVDPPRKGLSPDVIHAICAMRPKKTIYVSCDPATLARDLKIFTAQGFTCKKIIPIDLFPRCAHLETVALLQ